MSKRISEMRENYQKGQLLESNAHSEPLNQFKAWMNDAVESAILEPNAMNLATVGTNGRPSSRVVLLKKVSDEGLIFYTNYQSKKATELEANPFAAINFLWKEIERQVRIEGKVEKISRAQSERYFHSRPYGSQIGAISSHQSKQVSSRKILEDRYGANYEQFISEGKADMPDHWGGYLLRPDYFEFWQGRESRLHDRLEYKLGESGEWLMKRLEP